MALDDPELTPMAALAASVPIYPQHFPIPDREPYSYQVDMGVVRSAMAAGNSRQRRIYQIMPHYFSLVFHLRISDELFVWQTWVNEYAYEFFSCPVSTMYAGQPPDPSSLRNEILRFTGDLQTASAGYNLVSVTVSAELANDAHATAPPIGLAGWVIGGRADNPNPHWVIAGDPFAPSAAYVIAGTPPFPSSL